MKTAQYVTAKSQITTFYSPLFLVVPFCSVGLSIEKVQHSSRVRQNEISTETIEVYCSFSATPLTQDCLCLSELPGLVPWADRYSLTFLGQT